jgi:hypothetical protein
MDLMNTLDTEWARSISEMFTTEAMRELIKFWAMDTEPAGAGYATANITFQSLGIPFEIDDFCAQMNSVYKQMDIEIIEDLCDLRINDMDTARFTIRLKVGAISIKQFQYVYMKEKKLWALSIGVDETVWSEFEPTFITIAETFFVD